MNPPGNMARGKYGLIPAPLMFGIIVYLLSMVANAAFGQTLPT
jgi:hypothetical protein